MTIQVLFLHYLLFPMKNSPLYFLVPFVFCSSLSLAQTEKNSPLMMMRLGSQLRQEPGDSDLHDPNKQDPEEKRREKEAQDANTELQEERGSIIHASELQESLPARSEVTQNNDAAIRDFKNHQVELITSKIAFLKANYPDQTNLISLLESYLQKYEEVLDLRTFDQWRTDMLLQEEQKVELEKQHCSNRYAMEAQQSALKSLRCERNILNALLTTSVQLKRAREYSQLHSIYLLSKDAFENARRQLEQKSQYDMTIDEYINAEGVYVQAKKAYYNAVEEENRCRLSPNESKSLRAPAVAKKRAFQAYQASLNFNYGSLEKVKSLQQQCVMASDAMAKSGSFFKQKAILVEHLVTQRLGLKEIDCYHHQISTLYLLAQDHLSLAQAIIEENIVVTEHIKNLVSFALQAHSAFEHQLSISRDINQRALPWNIAESHKKLFHLFQKAGQCFLSAYDALKRETPSPQSQALHDRGLDLMNVAKISQLPPLRPDQRANYHPDWLATVDGAQYYAKLAIQTTGIEIALLYYEKKASLFYEKKLALDQCSEILSLKQNIKPNSFSSFFLEQSTSLFLKASNYFHQLSLLFLPQLNSSNAKSLIQAAFEAKAQASKLLFQTKALLSPPSAAPAVNQNQDLLSWSD